MAIGVFPAELETPLSSPSAAVVLLARFDFGDGAGGTITRRFHAGAGTIPAGGFQWQGVTDPGQTRLVKLSWVQLPTVTVAAKVDVTLTGVDKAFIAAVRQDIKLIYGATAEIYQCVFDLDTYEPITDPVLMFDNGVCGVPKFAAEAAGIRTLSIPIDGLWAAKNFEPGGRLNDADQKIRYPGDRGLELVGSAAYERIR